MKLCVAYPNSKLTYSETFIANHINGLKADVFITGGWCPYLENNKKTLFKFPFNIEPVRVFYKTFLKEKYVQRYTQDFTKFFSEQKIDVVFAEYGITGTMLAEACKNNNIPLVVHFHGFDAYHYKTLDSYLKDYQFMFGMAKAIVVVSEDMKKQIISLGCNPDIVYNIPYGVNIEKFTSTYPEKNPPVFVAVGRFTNKKAPGNTIKAFAQVCQEIKEARLVMIGNGELWNESKELIRTLKIEKYVTLKGVLSPERIAEELHHARCFVQHSIRSLDGDSEGFPNSILEAAASGLPVVSTLHAGIKESVIHGETGFLVEEGDIDGMADYMKKIAVDPELAGAMGRKGREHILKNYNLEKKIENLRTLILG